MSPEKAFRAVPKKRMRSRGDDTMKRSAPPCVMDVVKMAWAPGTCWAPHCAGVKVKLSVLSGPVHHWLYRSALFTISSAASLNAFSRVNGFRNPPPPSPAPAAPAPPPLPLPRRRPPRRWLPGISIIPSNCSLLRRHDCVDCDVVVSLRLTEK